MMSWGRTAVIVAAITGLGGCVYVDPADRGQVAAHVERSSDIHTGVDLIEGPEIEHFRYSYYVRTWLTSEHKGQYQVVLKVDRNDWAFLDQGYSFGERLDTVVIDRYKTDCSSYGCDYVEIVGVMVPPDAFDRALSEGFAFKVDGKRGSKVLNIPADYFIALQAAALNAQPADLGGEAAG